MGRDLCTGMTGSKAGTRLPRRSMRKENPRTYATTGDFQLLASREWGQGKPGWLARDRGSG